MNPVNAGFFICLKSFLCFLAQVMLFNINFAKISLMGLFSWAKKNNVEIIESGIETNPYDITAIGNLIVPEKLTDRNVFTLCNSVAELDFPVDFYADRISKLRRYIADKDGNKIENTELNRFINDSINPFYTFSDLVYQYVYSLLAYGNAISYLGIPSILGNKITVNNITRWDVLNPDLFSLDEYNNVSLLEVTDKKALIKRAKYSDNSGRDKDLNLNQLFIDNYSLRKQANSVILSKSPLFSRNKSIDTLLAVYSARYNVYANNGAAGYLAKKSLTQNNGSLEAAFMDTNHREAILKDINNRNGITGKRNLWGISGVPIEFVKTLATISELMPLDETLECSIKIASAFQIPPVLVPRDDQSTYDNQAAAEKNVWENGILAMDRTVNENLTRLFGLNKQKVSIQSDYEDVSCLITNAASNEDLITKRIANLKALKELSPDLDISNEVNKIYEEYGEKE